jgi:pilus assembly protein Flp/PilA
LKKRTFRDWGVPRTERSDTPILSAGIKRPFGSAATAIEYGLIAAGISLAIIAVVNGLGTKLNTKFTSINSSLK